MEGRGAGSPWDRVGSARLRGSLITGLWGLIYGASKGTGLQVWGAWGGGGLRGFQIPGSCRDDDPESNKL